MINIQDKKKCSGCSACYSVCPKGAITMKEDEEGFLYPKIDKDKCIQCGLCERVCPVLNVQYKELKKYPEAFLCYEEDVDSRIKSASGGAFYSLAKQFLTHEKSAVVGAAYDDEWMVHHIIVKDSKELSQLQKSKYVQSRMENVYKEVLELLKKDYSVLFSGTSCQIAGVKRVVPEKLQSKLFTIDVVCYGVPSPKVFQKYLDYQEKKYGKIKQVIIRDKKIFHSSFRVGYGMIFDNDKKYFAPHGIDPMARLFYSHYCLRPICYQCPYKTIGRISDITLGDCWYPEKYIKGFKDKYGITMLLVNSLKGRVLFDECHSLIKNKVDTEEIIKINGGKIFTSAVAPKDRDLFFEDLSKNMEFDCLANKYTKIQKDSLLYKITFTMNDWNIMPKAIRDKKRNQNIQSRLRISIPDEAKKQVE